MSIMNWATIIIGAPALIYVTVTDTKAVLIIFGGLAVFIAILIAIFSITQ